MVLGDTMKVLIIGPYPPPFAGPEMAIKMLLESPIKDQMHVDFLSTNVRKDNAAKGKVGFGMALAFFHFFSRLIVCLIKKRPHVVYYFVTATRVGWLGRDVWCIAISRLFGAQVVTHMRAGHFRHRLESAGWLEKALIKWACHRVRWSLVQAPSLRDQFEGLAPDDRIAVVPNMIDIGRYKPDIPEDYTPGRILFLGHLSVAKGYCEVLKIIPKIAEKYPAVKFEFAGAKLKAERNVMHVQTTGKSLPDEDPEECFKENIQSKFEGNYAYLGVLDESEKMAALQACDFLILPSFSEGFSMAILEAMAMGKPVVCAGVGAMRDFVNTGVNGEVFAPGDTKALEQGVLSLLDDKKYRTEIANHNAGYVAENFSQAVVADKLARLFKDAIS